MHKVGTEHCKMNYITLFSIILINLHHQYSKHYNNTPINITENVYTHSIQDFSKYVKLNFFKSYQENSTIYICSRS